MNAQASENRDNLTRLLNQGRKRQARVSHGYSMWIRGLRLLFPIVALGIVAILMIWPDIGDDIAPLRKEEMIPETAGRNELLEPRFEGTNRDLNPYTITANRAVQSLEDKDLVMLDNPAATIALDEMTNMDVKADNGSYRQEAQTLVLNGNVRLNHSHGYVMTAETINVSLPDRHAWTDVPVRIDGPSGDIEAQSMDADQETGVVKFQGPARMIVKQSVGDLR